MTKSACSSHMCSSLGVAHLHTVNKFGTPVWIQCKIYAEYILFYLYTFQSISFIHIILHSTCHKAVGS